MWAEADDELREARKRGEVAEESLEVGADKNEQVLQICQVWVRQVDLSHRCVFLDDKLLDATHDRR